MSVCLGLSVKSINIRGHKTCMTIAGSCMTLLHFFCVVLHKPSLFLSLAPHAHTHTRAQVTLFTKLLADVPVSTKKN